MKHKTSHKISDKISLVTDQESTGITYAVSLLAVAYAVALSSHDSVMVDYWDDLQEYVLRNPSLEM